MTALAEKLKSAGVDTLGARLATACTEAIRRHPDNVVDAWRYIGAVFGHEFVRGMMKDMRSPPSQKQKTSPAAPWRHVVTKPKPYQPRVVPRVTLEERRKLQEIVRSKYKTSDGRDWARIGPHEHAEFERRAKGSALDLKISTALRDALGANFPNDGRSYCDRLGVEKMEKIITAASREA